ncbi:hypothetical protein L917_12518, partial [Phytophthora nicotianae]
IRPPGKCTSTARRSRVQPRQVRRPSTPCQARAREQLAPRLQIVRVRLPRRQVRRLMCLQPAPPRRPQRRRQLPLQRRQTLPLRPQRHLRQPRLPRLLAQLQPLRHLLAQRRRLAVPARQTSGRVPLPTEAGRRHRQPAPRLARRRVNGLPLVTATPKQRPARSHRTKARLVAAGATTPVGAPASASVAELPSRLDRYPVQLFVMFL